eukprot:CAMPEP_0119024348 /NCGR_PEP_ID=MMETSP1176-20130426/31710_1 /TAXON_ID=265551 /ORGANISM="Synedropsis recta cf, Strain CCMP1620" /LENGTH=71 /DNA_ID=CAMNT_0006979619 /DNA_START=90 /DNA_END=301 /DNA_ORIENTATION=+
MATNLAFGSWDTRLPTTAGPGFWSSSSNFSPDDLRLDRKPAKPRWFLFKGVAGVVPVSISCPAVRILTTIS